MSLASLCTAHSSAKPCTSKRMKLSPQCMASVAMATHSSLLASFLPHPERIVLSARETNTPPPLFFFLSFSCAADCCVGGRRDPFGAFIAQLTWKKWSPSRCRFDSH
ncbi:hypothetical protein CEXT_291961 [Caerostris extrusa]|uniref:Uncharacterized protein n=1 Tax=Caerostris extrusa TaxID=172846 RepID=A0AAV4WZ83_CAEEX|nr:hypothetical protein CEXT_291961 [Caerostris extrusa]